MYESSPAAVQATIPSELVAELYQLNPWWTGAPAPPLPETRRHLVDRVRRRMDAEIAPIVAVRGPRQVGKTTIQLQIISDLLQEGVRPANIMRVQFDGLASGSRLVDPILRISEWFERNVAADRFNALAHQGEKAYLFLDEVQNLENWSAQLKFLVDTVAVKVLVTGSSTLRIEKGRDSLAGRIHTVEAGALSLTEIGRFRGLRSPLPFLPDVGIGQLMHQEFWQELREYGHTHRQFRDQSFAHFSQRGGYPLAHQQTVVEWPLLAEQLNETVIQRVIRRDLRAGRRGRRRDAALLEELFRLACRHVGRTLSYGGLAAEARLSSVAALGPQQVGNYLSVLADTMLLRLIPTLEISRTGLQDSPKLCLADHGLRAAWLREQVPLDPEALAARPELSAPAGRIAESAFGATAAGIRGLDVAHQPMRGQDPEVDFVFRIGDRRLPIAVQYRRRIDQLQDTMGIRSFVEKPVNRAPFGLLITQTDAPPADDPRIVSMPLSTFMMLT